MDGKRKNIIMTTRIPSLEQGTQIHCKNGHLVATVNRNLYKGDTSYSDAFDYAEDQTAPTKGQTEQPKCWCGQPWFDLDKRMVIK